MGQTPHTFESLEELFHIVEKGKATWEATFDAIQDPVLIIDPQYQIQRANQAASQRAGMDVRKLIGTHCYETFAGRKEVCPRCPLEGTVEQQKPHIVEIEKLARGNDFQVNSYPLMTAEGNQVVHHYRDVTEERRLQKQLLQSEKMVAIGMLAGGVAHEINNPLGGILAFTQLIKAEVPDDSPIQKDLSEIEEAAKRCKKIVEDLLSFARPSAGNELVSQNVNSLLDKLLPLLKLKLREAEITIQTDYGEQLPPVWGEANRLQQVFLNLIQNAVEAIRTGGVVTVRTRLAGNGTELYLEVQDTGTGIREEDLGKIFDPFFTTKGLKGTGLGLSICDSIIHDHHGRIEVESVWGKGTTFRVVLPVAKRERDR